ncbi:hypothetical protein [Pseudarthrobacter sp. NPDC057230]|uniref:hypothetical protein n=1 Tax=Pseudarthrobacter sp. NPDC057230 TaxID=3346057 RepID=UPI00362526BC
MPETTAVSPEGDAIAGDALEGETLVEAALGGETLGELHPLAMTITKTPRTRATLLILYLWTA